MSQTPLLRLYRRMQAWPAGQWLFSRAVCLKAPYFASYGGLGFSALAHHKVIQKIASISSVVSSTVGVPNSLGPGELLNHYGTKEQKDYYLPRLAVGEEVPCFGLTGPFAGSDATSIPDYGIVCKGTWQGQEVLGVRLTFDKRYITLAPVATLIGLGSASREGKCQ